jgi:GTP-binding protein
MLVDKVRVDFYSGKGGNGEGGLLTEYPVTDGGPGGYGGSVILEGDENIYDLKNFTAVHEYTAGDGDKGKRNEQTGAGEDIIVKVVTHICRLMESFKAVEKHKKSNLTKRW